MGISLDDVTGPVASSYGIPLSPYRPPGSIQVPFAQVEQFIRGFPMPPGARQVHSAVNTLVGTTARAFQDGLQSGDVQRMAQVFLKAGIQLAPALLGGAGAVLGLSSTAAGILAPLASGIPYVGAVVTAGLEVYAPLAAVGGTTVTSLAAAAQSLAVATAGATAATLPSTRNATVQPDPSDLVSPLPKVPV